jgi:hypothetical protein
MMKCAHFGIPCATNLSAHNFEAREPLYICCVLRMVSQDEKMIVCM